MTRVSSELSCRHLAYHNHHLCARHHQCLFSSADKIKRQLVKLLRQSGRFVFNVVWLVESISTVVWREGAKTTEHVTWLGCYWLTYVTLNWSSQHPRYVLWYVVLGVGNLKWTKTTDTIKWQLSDGRRGVFNAVRSREICALSVRNRTNECRRKLKKAWREYWLNNWLWCGEAGTEDITVRRPSHWLQTLASTGPALSLLVPCVLHVSLARQY